jgi:hypothetical protein
LAVHRHSLIELVFWATPQHGDTLTLKTKPALRFIAEPWRAQEAACRDAIPLCKRVDPSPRESSDT